jgi:hypothetical protein
VPYTEYVAAAAGLTLFDDPVVVPSGPAIELTL